MDEASSVAGELSGKNVSYMPVVGRRCRTKRTTRINRFDDLWICLDVVPIGFKIHCDIESNNQIIRNFWERRTNQS